MPATPEPASEKKEPVAGGDVKEGEKKEAPDAEKLPAAAEKKADIPAKEEASKAPGAAATPN